MLMNDQKFVYLAMIAKNVRRNLRNISRRITIGAAKSIDRQTFVLYRPNPDKDKKEVPAEKAPAEKKERKPALRPETKENV